MNDFISRADAMAYPLSWEHYDKKHGSREFISGVESYREYIEYLPSAQPKRGEWIYDAEAYPLGNPYGHYDCDQCGESVPSRTNYCPNCGAKMGVEP